MVGTPDFLTRIGQEQSPELQELDTPEGELHLRFYVGSDNEFALPAIGIREVIAQSPDRITPMPNVSPLLLGTLNLRGQVVWVADLGQFLGDSAPLNTDRAEIPVIAIEDQGLTLGLAVDRIGGMGWLDPDALRVATSAPDSMAPFLRGEWQYEQVGKVLRLLDQGAILRSARWAT